MASSNLQSHASSDLTLAFTIEQNNQIIHGISRYRGNKARTDLEVSGAPLSLIQSGDGKTVELDHKRKTWESSSTLLKPEEEPKQDSGGAIEQYLAPLRDTVFPMRFTGRTAMISGWKCEEFIMFDITPERVPDLPIEQQARMVAWVARDFPDGESIQKHIESVMPDENLRVFERIAKKHLGMPGFGMKTEMQRGSGPKTVFTYTAIKQGELPDTIFEIPSDYLQSLNKQ